MAVYKKTEKGMDELLAPSPCINLPLISVLILVDGEGVPGGVSQRVSQPPCLLLTTPCAQTSPAPTPESAVAKAAIRPIHRLRRTVFSI